MQSIVRSQKRDVEQRKDWKRDRWKRDRWKRGRVAKFRILDVKLLFTKLDKWAITKSIQDGSKSAKNLIENYFRFMTAS